MVVKAITPCLLIANLAFKKVLQKGSATEIPS